jgi:hypothetical protein
MEQGNLQFEPKPESRKRTNAEIAQNIREKRELAKATDKPVSLDPEEIAYEQYEKDTNEDQPRFGHH